MLFWRIVISNISYTNCGDGGIPELVQHQWVPQRAGNQEDHALVMVPFTVTVLICCIGAQGIPSGRYAGRCC